MALSITNPIIVDFYHKHKLLDFEKMNLLFVKILNKILSEVSPQMDNNFGLTILNEIKNISSNMDKTNIQNNNVLSSKILEMKKEYINDLQLIINNNTSASIKGLLQDYTQNINTHIDSKMDDFKNINKTSMDNQTIIDSKINEVLKKFDSSSKKGQMSEMATLNLLKTVYSERQIKIVSSTKESCDLLLIRNNKPVIFIENKDYKDNLPQTEVDKFIRDINTQNQSGIFLSQSCTIPNKKPFEIEFYGNNVGIYISNFSYNMDILEIAIETIDSIKSKIKLFNTSSSSSDQESEESDQESEEITIEKNDLDLLNKQFNVFLAQKSAHIKSIKDFSKKLITESEQMNLPVVQSIVSQMFGTPSDIKKFCCEIPGCNFVGKNKGALAGHQKACIKKQKNLENQNSN